MTERESLEIITSMIERTKARYIGSGNIMLMWGYLTVAVTVLVWVSLAMTRNPACNSLWFLIPVVGGILTPIMARKERKEIGAKSYSDKVTDRIWTMVGYSAIAMTICCFTLAFLEFDSWMAWFAFALIIVPFAEITQGIIVSENSLVFGGGLGLLAGIFTLCCIIARMTLYAYWFLPLFMFAFICMMIIPGHVINSKARRQR